jgi:hypothetical protein
MPDRVVIDAVDAGPVADDLFAGTTSTTRTPGETQRQNKQDDDRNDGDPADQHGALLRKLGFTAGREA